MKFTQVPSQYSKQIKEVQTRSEVWVCGKAPSTAYPAKAAPPSALQRINCTCSCRLLIAEKCGANNRREQGKAPLTFWYEIHSK
jgi:hypothetical protein